MPDLHQAKAVLETIADLLQSGGEKCYEPYTTKALCGSDRDLEEFLCSNELWGGTGSIADQALFATYNQGGSRNEQRKELERLLVDLGRIQLASGATNVRTGMWVEAFEHWQRSAI